MTARTYRSWLFAPAHDARKLAKLAGRGSDAVVLDLEDAVPGEAKGQARRAARAWLAEQAAAMRTGCFVRINALGSPHWHADLAAVLPGRPEGIVVPKVAGPDQLAELADTMTGCEKDAGIDPGTTSIVAMVGEDPAGALRIGDFRAAVLPRLAGLAWGSEDLAAALGASRKRDAAGEWTGAFRQVRAQLLLVARARGIAAIETVEPDFRDLGQLARRAGASAADGFDGMLAIHPAQVEAINRAFSPGDEELAFARAVVAGFAAQPGAAALQVAGRMVERLHLARAQQILARAP